MNVPVKRVNPNVFRFCKRFAGVEASQKTQWVEPAGYETNINLYNPITKTNVPLILKNKNVVRWYMCGPTVYDSSHIGHACTYVKSDIIRRILIDYFNINVITVMGITNIDDKIIRRAKQTRMDFLDVAKTFEAEFYEDMEALNVMKPSLYCRVTDYVPHIIQFIQKLIDQGDAYVAENGSVYFDTRKHQRYGKLSSAFEHSSHPEKRSSLDFSLWKGRDVAPNWECPWGTGRPGWHIECSAIASSVFGNSIDIHSGGVDLCFPHHENEEAQSCCYHKVDQWVNYWLHCGHLSLKGDVKMSKSLKNTINIQTFLKEYTGNQFRILCLLSHYRNGVEFSDDVMAIAVSVLKKIENFLNDSQNYVTGQLPSGNVDEPALLQLLEETKTEVDVALANDFNTAQAMRSLINLIQTANKMLHNNTGTSTDRYVTAVAAVTNYISMVFSKFGVLKSASPLQSRADDIIDMLVRFRATVRERSVTEGTKDRRLLTACDEVRRNLSKHGITIKDHKMESTWTMKKY